MELQGHLSLAATVGYETFEFTAMQDQREECTGSIWGKLFEV